MSLTNRRPRAELASRPYRLMRCAVVPKLSGRPGVAYQLLADPPDTPDPELFVAVVGNVGGGGLWSKEAVPLSAVTAAIAAWQSPVGWAPAFGCPRGFMGMRCKSPSTKTALGKPGAVFFVDGAVG